MKKKSTSQSAFFNLRALIRTLVCLAAVAVAVGAALYIGASKTEAQTGPRSAAPAANPPLGSCSWAAGPDMPMADTRSVGVFFPANGKFYAMGGRDVNNVELPNPFEYDPASNSWTTKSATYPDAFTNNMALRRAE